MVKVHEEGAFRVYVYSPPREHQPPHVHVECTRGGEVLVQLGDERTLPSLWQNHHMSAVDAREPFGSFESTSSISWRSGGGSMARPERMVDLEFERENERAIREAREADRVEPRASAASYDPRHALILVKLRSGFAFGFPPERIEGLKGATADELANIRISPSGDGLHWDDLDVDASLTGLMADALNLREWAPRLMGQVRSEAKAKAARINGLKGGRPRKSKKPTRRSKGATGTRSSDT